MSIRDMVWSWNVTEDEWRATYPCDKYVKGPHRIIMRAIDVEAPAGLMFRWLCQLTVAPYSYDWLDNRFRRSPRQLTPGADRLEDRQLLLCPITEFETGSHITVAPSPQAGRVYGILAVTDAVRSTGPGSCRVVVRVALDARSRLDRVRAEFVAWGDFIMMRKQLLTLKKLAERDARTGLSAAAAAATRPARRPEEDPGRSL